MKEKLIARLYNIMEILKMDFCLRERGGRTSFLKREILTRDSSIRLKS